MSGNGSTAACRHVQPHEKETAGPWTAIAFEVQDVETRFSRLRKKAFKDATDARHSIPAPRPAEPSTSTAIPASEPVHTVNFDNNAQQRPMMSVSADHGQMLAPTNENDSEQTRRIKDMLKKYSKLDNARVKVRMQQMELGYEYEDLLQRMAEALGSQEEMVNAIKDVFRDSDQTSADLRYIYGLWETTKSDVATFDARYSRIRQLLDLLARPEVELITLEDEFIKTAQSIVDDPQRLSDVSGQIEVPSAAAPAAAATGQPMLEWEDFKRQTLQDLRTRRADLAMFRDRLDELNYEQNDDQEARDFLVDRGDAPEQSEAEFMLSYWSARAQIEKDIASASEEVERLEGECDLLGIDHREEPEDLSSLASQHSRHGSAPEAA